MKYCTKCGKEIMDEAVVCPACGCSQGMGMQNPGDSSSFGYALLGFCIPILGLILYLVWLDSKPLRAKSAGKGALVSVILSVIVTIVVYLLIGGALISVGGI